MRDKNTKKSSQRSESLKSLERKIDQRANDKISFIEKLVSNWPLPFLYPSLLRLLGFKIGKNVTFKGKIKIKIRGKFKNVSIGDGVVIGYNVSIINREDGKIRLEDHVYLDDNVRLLAARNGLIRIDKGTEVGFNTVINSGGNVYIGKFCMIASFVNINSSSHGQSKNLFIKDQEHIHGEVIINDDVWIGANASISIGSNLGCGCIIGSNSFVNSTISEFGIAVGSPAKLIKHRS